MMVKLINMQCCVIILRSEWCVQKYRSHRKHLMAREAEAATWAQKRQLYAAAPVARKAVEAAAAVAGPPWVVPTLGFPPPPPAAMAPHPPPFCRPLHVWGHPPTTCAAAAAVEAPGAATMLPVWPRHLAPPRAWVDPGYWHQHQQQQYNVRARPLLLAAIVVPACDFWF
jgi:hypothetical protein